MSDHGYTKHGHPCCGQAPVSRPSVRARCGGPRICSACALEANLIHVAIANEVEARAAQRLFDLGEVCRRIDAESRARVAELDAATGCEAASEREFHRGHLVAVAEVMKVLGG